MVCCIPAISDGKMPLQLILCYFGLLQGDDVSIERVQKLVETTIGAPQDGFEAVDIVRDNVHSINQHSTHT